MSNYIAVIGKRDLGHGNRKIQIQDLSGPKSEFQVSELIHIDVSLF